jgi:hypothetical protein
MVIRTLKKTPVGDNAQTGKSAGNPPLRPGSDISVIRAPAREPSPHDIARGRVAVVLAASALSLCACQSPPPVSYAWDVSPILEQKCVPCHTPPDGEGYVLSGLDMSSYEGLIRGYRYGPVIVPGDSRHSVFNMAGEGRIHPFAGATQETNPLSDEEAEILKRWVDQGARNN